jgi:serine/threonine-protein kinase
VISGVLALAVVTWPTVACHRKNPAPPPTKSQPLDDELPPPGQSGLVLVWMETTPPAARIVRVSDGHVLGYSPEIIEFRYTKKPVQIRFELEGYIPLTREVSAAVDAELKFVLEPIPKAPPPASKKSKGSKGHRNSN